MRNRVSYLMAAAALSAMSLAGCGSGGGAAPATVVSRGVITQTGSIYVNGVEFDVAAANVQVNGTAASASSLQPGMVVTVKGTFDNMTSQTRATAASVEYDDILTGPVDSVNTLNDAITVMGQPVIIMTGTAPNKTVFQNFSSLSQLTWNQSNIPCVAQVSGFSDGSGGIQATRIELVAQTMAPSTLLEARGAMSALDTNVKTFKLGNMTVDYSGIDPIYLPSPLADGQYVEVKGMGSGYTTSSAPTLKATDVLLKTQALGAQEGDHILLEGFVTDLSGTTFRVEGTTVDSSSILNSGIANAAKVEVEGVFTKGVVKASKITLL